jgi:hypothetical protein
VRAVILYFLGNPYVGKILFCCLIMNGINVIVHLLLVLPTKARILCLDSLQSIVA